jgi:DNA-binding response OmpR family regulator
METILVIEDDPRIQKALERQFAAEGYTVHVSQDGDAGLAAAFDVRPDAVVLDLMLPGLSGREICKKIKAEMNQTPVIVLSAVSEIADKVLLLELGADDYVTKPFSPRELLARVQAAIRRNQRSASKPAPAMETYSFGNIVVNFVRMDVLKEDVHLVLTAYEFKLLRYFIEHTGHAVTREKLLSEVWGYQNYPTTRTVDNLVLKLRQKLEPDPANPVHFQTMHGIGYRFEPQPASARI